MVIAKYISDLLFDYECVVIPGLGGFIINDKPATINYNTHHFNPPFRQVSFNPYLLTNDGLLINYIAKEEKITYKQAKKQLDEFVKNCHNTLNNGKSVKFDKIGTIFKDENDKIIFEQDLSVNYNPESFGLSSFISPAIRKPTQEERIKEVFAKNKDDKQEHITVVPIKKRTDKRVKQNRQKQKKNKSKTAPWLIIALLFLILLGGWAFINGNTIKNYYNTYSYKIPFFYSNPGSYVANNVEILPAAEVAKKMEDFLIIKKLDNLFSNNGKKKSKSTNNKDFSLTRDSETYSVNDKQENDSHDLNNPLQTGATTISPSTPDIAKSEPELNTASATENDGKLSENPANTASRQAGDEQHVSGHLYYIIAGSFKNQRNALRLVEQLKQQGYNSMLAGTNGNGMTRVAYQAFPSLTEARQVLQQIRATGNPDAWIMRK